MEHDSVQEVREQLAKILRSKKFQASPALTKLLRYLVDTATVLPPEQRKAHLKEGIVSFEVFGEHLGSGDEKKSNVRVHASNLRKALAEYYAGDGAADEIIITVPPGGYVPAFDWRSDTSTSPSVPRPEADALPALASSLRYTLTIEADAQHLPELLRRLHETLLTAPGQPSLRVDYSGQSSIRPLYIRHGSILLYFECTAEGYLWLSYAWQSGSLERAFGHPVIALTPSDENYEELCKSSSSSMEQCETLPVAMPDTALDEMFLMVENPWEFDFWPVVHLVLLHSRNLKSWRKILSRQLTIPTHHGYYLYHLNFGRFGMPSVIENPPKLGGRTIGVKFIRDTLWKYSRNTFWESELPKFTKFYSRSPAFQGGWLRAEVHVVRYDYVSSLAVARAGLELTINQPKEYTPHAIRETIGGVRHYTPRPKRRFVCIAIRTDDLSTPKPREVTPPLDADALLSEFDQFSQGEDANASPDNSADTSSTDTDSR